MRRWHEETAIMKKNLRERIKSTRDESGQHIFEDDRAKMGYYRKRDAYDCGKPGCGICHPVEKGKGKDKHEVQHEIEAQLLDRD